MFQVSPDDLLLRLWRHQDLRLFLSTQAPRQGLYLTTSRFHNPSRPPRFAALLRARLAQVRLHRLTVQPYDRVVSLTWERPGEAAPVLTLVHELQGTQSNLILVDAMGVILDALKQVPAEAPSRRPLVPGYPYQAPPLPPHRVLVSALTVEHLQHLQQQGTLMRRTCTASSSDCLQCWPPSWCIAARVSPRRAGRSCRTGGSTMNARRCRCPLRRLRMAPGI